MAFRHKTLILALAAALALGFAGDAFARAGSGSSFGSRGARTFSAPSATPLAPRAAPVERSMTSPNENMFRRPSPVSPGGFFSGGFGRGLLGGFIGAGLFGLLFGHGLFGGLGGGLSVLGLLLQIGLLFLLFKLVMGFVRARRPAFQGSGYAPEPSQGMGQGGTSSFSGFGGSLAGAAPSAAKLDITPADFGIFEERLAAIQTAFGGEDFDRLRALTTPEMASYFAEQLAANAKQGVVNRLSDVKFLDGDLAEAWREPQGDYATVAMRFSLIDTMADRVSGKIVSGDPAVQQQVTEVWTFARRPGGTLGDWKLAAIQQA